MQPDISQYDFSHFVQVSQLFILSLENGVVQRSAIDDETAEVTFREHLKTLRNRIFGSPSKRTLKEYNLSDVTNHYSNTQPIKKVFVNKVNEYIVKKFFTEGLQYVEEGETHTYEPHGKPLDLFLTSFDLPQEYRLNTLEARYDSFFKQNRVQPGQKGAISSGAYYLVVAPCHTFFEKVISKVSTALQISDVRSQELPNDGDTAGGPAHRNEIVPSEPGTEINERLWSPQPFTSREIVPIPASSRRSSTQSPSWADPAQRSENSRASSKTHESHPKRVKLEASVPAQVTDTQLQHSGRNQADTWNADAARRTVFGIRKSGCIESYVLEPDSSLSIGPDDQLSGSFRMRNDDMDPYVVEYNCRRRAIQEVAHFKNDSTFLTHIEVQGDLLKQLRETGRRREKVVVNYFFDAVFKKIEAAYHRFVEMRNTGMIASCVPAIVQADATAFSGTLSDTYEVYKRPQNK